MMKLQDIPLPIAAIKIRNIKSEIRDVSYDIIPDKIIIRGVIHKQVFFVGTDNIVHHQSDDMPFSTFVEVPGAAPGMLAQIEIAIEKVIPEISPDGLVIIQKVILNIFVKIEEEEVIRPALDPDGTLVELRRLIGEAETERTIKREVMLNQAAEKIDEVRGTVTALTASVGVNQVTVSGSVTKEIFYVNLSGESVNQEEVQNFSYTLPVPGALPGMDVTARASVEDIDFELNPDENTLEQTVFLNISVQVTEPVQLRVAPGFEFLAKVPVVIGEDTTQLLKTSSVTLDRPAKNLVGIKAEIGDVSTDVILDKVLVRGTINKTITYIGLDNIQYQEIEEVPFDTFVNIPGAVPGQLVRTGVRIEGKPFAELLSETLLRQELVLEIFVKVLELSQLYLRTAAAGPEIVLPLVVTENTKQILVEQEKRRRPVRELIIEFETIVFRERVLACAQKLLDNIVNLPCPAVKIKEITPEVIDVQAELIMDDLAVVTGKVVKDIAFVCGDLVQHQEEIIPFRIEIPLPGPVAPGVLNPVVTIEKVISRLLPGGEALREIVVLRACVNTGGAPRFQRVVTRIEGTGITTETVLVREEVVVSETPLVTEVRTFPVVTDVNDPLGLLTTVIKEVLNLNVVGEGRQPVEVVVFAE